MTDVVIEEGSATAGEAGGAGSGDSGVCKATRRAARLCGGLGR